MDGLNRGVAVAELAKEYEPARAAYRTTGNAERLVLAEEQRTATTRWLLAQLETR